MMFINYVRHHLFKPQQNTARVMLEQDTVVQLEKVAIIERQQAPEDMNPLSYPNPRGNLAELPPQPHPGVAISHHRQRAILADLAHRSGNDANRLAAERDNARDPGGV
jgi:hypothetical protein